jgi:hypothetical protein
VYREFFPGNQGTEAPLSMNTFLPVDTGRSLLRPWPAGLDSIRQSPAVLCVLWLALVAVGVLGRLWQPTWNVTPMAGVALAAGVLFPHALVAASVPLVSLALGNLALPGYGSLTMACVVYAATVWPVLLGSLVSRGRWLALLGGALASSLVFFLSTNVAHWLLTTDYPRSAAGLVACFTAALPFYRWMPVGDLAWTAGLFAGIAIVGAACGQAGFGPLHAAQCSVRPRSASADAPPPPAR